MSSSSDINLDGGPGATFDPLKGDGPTQPQGQVVLPPYEKPPMWMQQFNKAAAVLLNSGLVALIRSWYNPPKTEAPTPGSAPGVPEWYAEEYAARARDQRVSRRILRDTAVFFAACYAMDGVEHIMGQLRGAKDAWNRVMGGVAAGGIVGLAWYPWDPRARALLTGTGALIAYVSSVVEASSNGYLLQQQQQLEKDLLHKPEADLRSDLDPFYLRQLLRLRQQQHLQQQQAAVAEYQRELARQGGTAPGGSGTAPGGYGTFASSGLGAAGGDAGSGPGTDGMSGGMGAEGAGEGGFGAVGGGGSGSGMAGMGMRGAGGGTAWGVPGGAGSGSAGGGVNEAGVLVITEDGDQGQAGSGMRR